MKSVWMATAGLAVALGVMLQVQPVVAMDSAIVIKNDGACGMVGSDANGEPVFGGLGQVETVIENDNKVMLKCKGAEIANPTGESQSFRGFPCGVQLPSGGFTPADDSHATVSESGVGTLTCSYRKVTN